MAATPIENNEFSQENKSEKSNSLEKPDFRQETRLGLVLYGGVSLAVYMNGVCREFYNAMRGRGIYKLIKALTDSDIVVDIVSGTSAGGINGVLLSYAIANSYKDNVVDFEEFADIWRENGDINHLLRIVEENKSKTAIDSVLDGEGYYQEKLFEAFKKAGMKKKPAIEAAPAGEWYSDFKELDLFITGTDVIGRIYTTFDNTGKVIEIKDHRSVFHLKYREDQDFGDPFSLTDDITQQALAKLCRITSCFPVAFPVVTVKLDPKNEVSSKDKIDKKLEEWGNLLEDRILPEEKPNPDGYQLHFVDGGVLDNRPFSYTTEAIYYRTADRPVNLRKLFYLDPSPDNFIGSESFNEMAKPDIWKVINDSLISLPRYESIGKDLQEITERNDKVRRYKLLRDSISLNVERLSTESDTDTEAKNRYRRIRLVALRDRVLPFLFDSKKIAKSSKNDSKQLLEETAKLLAGLITDEKELKDRNTKLNEVAEQIHYLDSQYAFRHHNFLIDKIFLLMTETQDKKEYESLKNLANQISYILEIIKVIDQALQEMFKSEKVRHEFYEIIKSKDKSRNDIRKESYEYLLKLFYFLLDVDSQDLSNDIVKKLQSVGNGDTQSNNIFKELIKPISDNLNKKIGNLALLALNENRELIIKYENDTSIPITINKYQDRQNYNLFNILESVSTALIEQSHIIEAEELKNDFSDFDKIDQIIYPYEYLADIQGKDSIEVVRISPNDANKGFGKGFGNDNIDRNKLAGSQLGAFGGFFKKSWRSNDILWGRLDGLNRIVDGLLTLESLQSFPEFVSRESQNQNLTVEHYLHQLVNESFPNTIPENEDPLEQEKPSLKDLLTEQLVKFATPGETLTKADLEDLKENLVLLGHRVILNENLGNVFKDAMDQQLEWNQQQVAQQKSKKFVSIPGYFDPVLTPLAVQALAKVQTEELLKNQNKIDDYFLKTYRVGSETIAKDIPPSILQKLGARTSIILRNVVESTSVGKWLRRRLKTYKIASLFLDGYYWLLQWKQSLSGFITISILFIVSIALLVWLFNLLNQLSHPALAIFTTLILILLLLSVVQDIRGWLFRKK